MTTETRKVIFVLETEQDEKIDAIAAYLSTELGVPVNRSAAIRVLINRFFLPDWSFNRPKNVTATKSA
jgi:hypothetical protein